MTVRVGADVGGTFTDLYLVDDARRTAAARKVPTTPADPSIGIVSGVLRLLAETGNRPEEVSHLIHGTTVATNTVLQRSGSLTGLITTEGFRDVLEIARQRRPDLYDLTRDTGQRLADGAPCGGRLVVPRGPIVRAVDGDDGCAFRHAITLNRADAELIFKGLGQARGKLFRAGQYDA